MQKILFPLAACILPYFWLAGCAASETSNGGDGATEATGGGGYETAGPPTRPPSPPPPPPPPPPATELPPRELGPAYAGYGTGSETGTAAGSAKPRNASGSISIRNVEKTSPSRPFGIPANGQNGATAAIFCKPVGKRTSAAQCALYDEEVANLEQGVAAFDPPRKMTKGQTVLVRLGIARDDGSTPSRAQDIIGGGETTVVRKLKIGAMMRAQLSGGAAFKIDPAAPQDKFLGGSLEDQWEWNVTALVAGQHSLSATITVLAEDGTPLQKFISNPISVDIAVSEKERLEDLKKKRLEDASFWTEYGEKLAKLWGVWLALAIAIAVGVWRFVRTARTGTDPIVEAILPEEKPEEKDDKDNKPSG